MVSIFFTLQAIVDETFPRNGGDILGIYLQVSTSLIAILITVMALLLPTFISHRHQALSRMKELKGLLVEEKAQVLPLTCLIIKERIFSKTSDRGEEGTYIACMLLYALTSSIYGFSEAEKLRPLIPSSLLQKIETNARTYTKSMTPLHLLMCVMTLQGELDPCRPKEAQFLGKFEKFNTLLPKLTRHELFTETTTQYKRQFYLLSAVSFASLFALVVDGNHSVVASMFLIATICLTAALVFIMNFALRTMDLLVKDDSDLLEDVFHI